MISIIHEEPSKIVDTYSLFANIGSGAQGEVFISCSLDSLKDIKIKKRIEPSHQILACKRISIVPLSNEPQLDYQMRLKECEQEIEIMKKLNHPNVVAFIDNRLSYTAHYIFMEYCSQGDMKNFVIKFNKAKYGINYEIKTMAESDASYVIREIMQGLYYLSSNLVMHRDIKLTNIMVNLKQTVKDSDPVDISNYEFKIGDMGLAKTLCC